MIRFTPSRTYLSAAAIAFGLAAFSGWCARNWPAAAIPAVLFVASAGLVLFLGTRPSIEVRESGLVLGSRRVVWPEIRRVDQTGWISPLVVYLSLAGGERIRVLFPGSVESCNHLLRLLQQNSTQALLNGIPYHQIWGEPVRPAAPAEAAQQVRLLTEEDEAEVERLYQKLRTAGHLDPDK
jgi:hypothetical protein